VVFKKGKKAKYVYLVMRGTGELRIDIQEGNLQIDKRANDVVGVESLLSMHYTSQLTARETFFSLRITSSSILKIFYVYPEIEREFWLVNMQDLLNLHSINLEKHHRDQLATCPYRILHSNEAVTSAVLLVRGRLQIGEEQFLTGFF
jgi:hypothetical protein